MSSRCRYATLETFQMTQWHQTCRVLFELCCSKVTFVGFARHFCPPVLFGDPVQFIIYQNHIEITGIRNSLLSCALSLGFFCWCSIPLTGKARETPVGNRRVIFTT